MRILYIFIVLFFCNSLNAQIWIEDFDGSSSVPFSLATECGSGSFGDWFGVICGPGDGCPVEIGASPSFIYNNVSGSFLSAFNTDGTLCGPSDEEMASWTGIDISSCSSTNRLYLCVDLAWAAFNNAVEGWDPPSIVEFTYSIDGAAFSNLINIEDQGQDTAPAFDLDCDGVGDAGTINSTFSTFCFEISEYGSNLDLTILFDGLNESNEDIGIDNVSIWCEADMADLPASVFLACGACGTDEDCDGFGPFDDCDDSDPSVTVNAAPPVATAANINVCEGDNIALDETFHTSGTWSWEGPDGTIYPGQAPVPFPATMDDNGTFTVTYTAANGCQNTDDIIITVNAAEDSSFSFANYCEDSTNGPSGITTPGGTFSFNPNPGDGASIDPITGIISDGIGGTTYMVSYTTGGMCPGENTIPVTVETLPDAGMSGTLSVCQGTTPTEMELFNALLGTPQTGGVWTNVGLTYTYTVNSAGLCPNATADVIVIEEMPPNAGMNGALTVCQGTTPTEMELFNALLGTPQTGGIWTNVGLTYTYTITSMGVCPDESADVILTEETPPNAGMNGTLMVCQGDTPSNMDLFNALLGTPEPGGIWTNVGLTYTYTVPSLGVCPDASAEVLVMEDVPPNAGMNGTLTVCQGTTPSNTDLFSALNGTPDVGGIWTNVGLIYTYTVSSLGPCPDESADVTVTEEVAPNAGTNGTLTICQGDTPSNADLLAALGGTPDAGGVWTNVGLVYTYTVNSSGFCPNASADVVVTEEVAPNAGINGTLNVCQGDTPSDAELFAALNGTPDAGGVWSNIGNTYTYTVSGISICPDETADVIVTEDPLINVGFVTLDNTYCVNESVVLPPFGDGSITGSWEDENGSLTTTLNTTVANPALTYTFIPDAGQGCWQNTMFTFEIEPCACANPPSVNIAGQNIICEGESADLTASVTNALFDGWLTAGDGMFSSTNTEITTYTPGPSDIINGSVQLTAITNDPDGLNDCMADTEIFILTIDPLPNAGTISAPSSICLEDPNIFTAMTDGDMNGTWASNNTGVVNINNAGIIAVIGSGNVTISYTVLSGTCMPAITTHDIEIIESSPVTFTNLPTTDVCEVMDLPDVAGLPQPNEAGVLGTWSSVDNGDDSFTYTFQITGQPADQCFIDPSPFTINVSGEVEVSFTGLPMVDVCEITDLPDVASLPQPNQAGVIGTWTSIDNGDNTHTYSFVIDNQPADGCFVSSQEFTIEVSGAVEVSFTGLPIDDVCEISGLPDVASLPQPDEAGVSGTWTSVDNGDGTHTYSFTIDNQPMDACFVSMQEFTLEVSGAVEVTFTGLPMTVACEISDLPDVASLPQPDQAGVTGTWTIVDNGNGTHTYSFNIDNQPVDGCFISLEMFTLEILGTEEITFTGLVTDDVCDVADLPNVASLPQPNEAGVTGTWTIIDNGDDTHTYSFMIDNQPANECFVESMPFTIAVSGEIEISFTALPTDDVCDASDLPEITSLPQPDQTGVSGMWSIVDNGDDTHTYSFVIDNQPADGCFIDTAPFTIAISDEVEISFTDLPSNVVCEISDLPNVVSLPQPDQAGVTGTWMSVDNGDGTHTYSFVIDNQPVDACFVSISPFDIEVSGSLEVSFSNLPLDDVCEIADLPDAASLPQPDQTGVSGMWSIVDNGDDTHTYSFVIDNQPADGCFVSSQMFTIEVLGTQEISFTGITTDDVCDQGDLPDAASLPQPDQAGVSGTWSSIDNGDGSHTYSFVIDNQPADGCFIETMPFTIEVSGEVEISFTGITTDDVCDQGDLPDAASLPQPDQAGVSGTWTSTDNGDGTHTYSFVIDNQPADGCFVEGMPFTISVSGSQEISFSNLPDDMICDVEDLPAPTDLPMPDQAGVTGVWNVTDNGDGTFTFNFIIDNQPGDGCFVSTQSFTYSLTGTQAVSFGNLFEMNCLDDIVLLPIMSDEGIIGEWFDELGNMVDSLNTNFVGSIIYTFIPDPEQGCWEETMVSFNIEDCNCGISPVIVDIACAEESFDDNPSNDFILFTLNPTIGGAEGTYFVTSPNGIVQPASGIYGDPTTFRLPNGTAGNGDVIITIVDNSGLACEIDVVLTDPGSCSSEPPKVYIPTAFTPNNDGVNDRFIIGTNEPLFINSFRIYDRWGNRAWEERELMSDEVDRMWDGTYNGNTVSQGVYAYVIEVTLPTGGVELYTGTITINR